MVQFFFLHVMCADRTCVFSKELVIRKSAAVIVMVSGHHIDAFWRYMRRQLGKPRIHLGAGPSVRSPAMISASSVSFTMACRSKLPVADPVIR